MLHPTLPRRFFLKHLAVGVLAASTLSLGPGLTTVQAQTTTPNKHWIGTWGNSSPTGLSPAGYNNQTIRVMAHISLGGKRARVRLTNEFGTKPLTIGSAHIALRGPSVTAPGSQPTTADIQATTDRQLTFSGQASINIPRGAIVLSDPVELPMPDLSDVAVSVYLPRDTGPVTYHAGVPKTSYVSMAGDHTADAVFPVASTTTTLPIVSDIEVYKSKSIGTIVALGDSITQGLRSTTDQDNRWSDFLAYRLINTPDLGDESTGSTMRGRAVINEGISGNRFLHDMAGPNLLARFETDVLSKPGVSHVIVLISINDISGNGTDDARQRTSDPTNNLTGADFVAGYRQIIARAHEKGIKIYGATITPFNRLAGDGESIREDLNNYIRTSGEFDGVVDFDKAIRDPNNPTKFFPAYDSGDGLHPNDQGYTAMGNSIDLSMFQ